MSNRVDTLLCMRLMWAKCGREALSVKLVQTSLADEV